MTTEVFGAVMRKRLSCILVSQELWIRGDSTICPSEGDTFLDQRGNISIYPNPPILGKSLYMAAL